MPKADGKVEVTTHLKFEWETKNTFKFEEKPEVGKPPVVGTIYFQKWFLSKPLDEYDVTITLTPKA